MGGMAEAAISVRELRKRYGDYEAGRGISFDVARGEVFGLLGPNGAGKTTTVEILEGYRERSDGEVAVLGHDPAKRERALQERVGIVLQGSAFYPHATVNEAVGQFARFYPHPREPREIVAWVGREEKADARTKSLSGGQKRRLARAPALGGAPEVIFLDEPTTGLAPAARRTAWRSI